MKAAELACQLISLVGQHGDVEIDCSSIYDEKTDYIHNIESVEYDSSRQCIVLLTDL